jgi:hypothetical protein
MYIVSYGLAPYFRSLLSKNLANEPYVLIFDESPNKQQQKKQMDILIRFWHHGTVKSRYYNTSFMGHATAVDLLDTVTSAVEDLNLGLMCQLSMDGPNVNFCFHGKLCYVI